MELEITDWGQGRLSNEAWLRSAMGLGGVNEERMAKIDIAGEAGRKHLRAVCNCPTKERSQLHEGQAVLAFRLQNARDIEVRTYENSRRSICRTNI